MKIHLFKDKPIKRFSREWWTTFQLFPGWTWKGLAFNTLFIALFQLLNRR